MGYKDPDKRKEYQRVWLAARRTAYFADKCCASCGSLDKLELDHIDPTTKDPKLKNGNCIWSWSTVRREKELQKCQVLCETCHLRKTIVQFERVETIKHGSETMRYKYGCTCFECKEFIRETKRQSRKRVSSVP